MKILFVCTAIVIVWTLECVYISDKYSIRKFREWKIRAKRYMFVKFKHKNLKITCWINSIVIWLRENSLFDFMNNIFKNLCEREYEL